MLNKTYSLKFRKNYKSFPDYNFCCSFEKGYVRKRASVSSKEVIEAFLKDAPNNGEYIHMKAGVVYATLQAFIAAIL